MMFFAGFRSTMETVMGMTDRVTFRFGLFSSSPFAPLRLFAVKRLSFPSPSLDRSLSSPRPR